MPWVRAFQRKVHTLSVAIPQFVLLAHVSSLRLPSGHSGLVPTLRNVACTSLISPRLLVMDGSIWASLLGVVVRHIICGVFFSFPVMFPSEIPNLPTDPPVRGFPGVWKLFLLHNALPGWVSITNSFVSLFTFYILSYLLSERMGCLSGCLVSSASV